ncbi:MAG: DUF929 family protein [Micromonosporaceae bacterium]|nr:DUF929 family protein [Micromonosporaceae bacterium]
MSEPNQPRDSRAAAPASSHPSGRSAAAQWRLALAGAAVAAVVVVLGSMVLIKATASEDEPEPRPSAGVQSSQPVSPETAKVVAAVTSVPAAVLDRVGKGDVAALPKALQDQPLLRDGDKPLVIFIGSESCPHCGTQRWAVAIALARFGTFSGLNTSPSGGTPKVLSFHGATYTSSYLAFQGAEVATSAGQRLDKLTPQQEEIMSTYGSGSVPFLDLGNQYIMIGSAYSASSFSGKSALDIAEALSDPASPITMAIGGGANALTTAICSMTSQQPSEVCSSPAAQAYAGAF